MGFQWRGREKGGGCFPARPIWGPALPAIFQQIDAIFMAGAFARSFFENCLGDVRMQHYSDHCTLQIEGVESMNPWDISEADKDHKGGKVT